MSNQPRGLQVLRYQNPLLGSKIYDDVTESIEGLTFQTLANGGFGQCSFTVVGAYTDLWQWVNPKVPVLTNRILILDPAMNTVYEGFIFQVEMQVNDFVWSASMQNLYNKVHIEFENDSKIHLTVNNTSSQTHFGIKSIVEKTAKMGGAAATAIANRILNEYNDLQHGKETALTGNSFGRNLKVKCMGYWSTLSWRQWWRNLKKQADTSVVIEDVLTKRGQFISTDYSNIKTAGVIVDRNVTSPTVVLDYIQKLVDYGNSTNVRTLAQVWENRVFWFKSRPTTVKYFTDLSGEMVYDSAGNVVPLYQVRAGNFLKFRNLSTDLSTYADSISDPLATFVEETNYDADNDTLSIRPPGSISSSLWLGRLVRGRPPHHT